MSTTAPSGPPAPVLEVRNIVKTFGGVTALGGVSLDLRPGEVLCLAGENGSGKSTLIKVISGAERPDSGEIVIDGKTFTAMDTTDAIKSGIQVIYQDFSLFPNLTAAENIVFTSAVASRHRLYAPRAARPAAERVVADLGLTLDLDADVEKLSVADKQLTAICRSLVNDARVIIMDEPTTALTHTEVARLFTIVERLRARGVAFIFVSHKLDEVLAISDRVTVLRSGKHVVTRPAAELSLRSIAEHMTGHELDETRRVSGLPDGTDVVLDVENLTLPGAYHDVSFNLRRGEILGLTGLLGSGRTEIAESLFGVHPPQSGSVTVDGVPVRLRSVDDAIAAGIGYVPEDRLTQGLFLEKSIASNIIASSAEQHRTRWRSLDKGAIGRTIDSLFSRLRIKAPNVQAPVRSLSGGNAQRVVLAKWLARRPKVLMLNGPTVGVDVGSKSEILEILRAQAAEGMGVLVISDDAPELVACCHRVLVVRHGRIVDVLEGTDIDVDTIRKKVAA
ncbi:sugar ABC transporter ATP-binding protein [Georgenia wutianyii]|uniref:Sugar ABC transporter ATP-binding protein n=1 Tax=Georgenia wutianyii TaxID=2585135 RepID=A0ABX5VKG3_9MICO|nr:sugar ABC transporter ATP-binding protein [Georgenia wutianyii]QDB78648.1 sugar ABC transporter ATP-binding protein [Georgenia wutianyii]